MSETMNSSEFARRMGVAPNGPGDWAEYDRFINREVRPLPQVGAYKAEDTRQAQWIITEEQAREVARKLGRPFT
jgi:hypothetical protein